MSLFSCKSTSIIFHRVRDIPFCNCTTPLDIALLDYCYCLLSWANRRNRNHVPPSAEEIAALRAERAIKKEEKLKAAAAAAAQSAQATDSPLTNLTLAFLKTEFVKLPSSSCSSSSTTTTAVKLLSWNILAQGLIRRTLFPGSDCVRFKDRNTLFAIVAAHNPDIATLQEVDRWQRGNECEYSDHLESIAPNTYQSIYAKGYLKKKHGLLILYKKHLYQQVGGVDSELLVKLDDLVLPFSDSDKTGCSRVTRNIGLAVALRRKDDCSKGLVVVTHHVSSYCCCACVCGCI